MISSWFSAADLIIKILRGHFKTISMKKIYISLLACATIASCVWYVNSGPNKNTSQNTRMAITDDEENESDAKDKYDGPEARDAQEAMWMQDPALGYVPYNRLNSALEYTHLLRDSVIRAQATNRTQSIMLWQERGPIYDSVGPSNGNTRGNDLYTSGRMAAVLIDTLNDPTGNTAIVGGIAGGVWKCKDFLSAFPTWKNVNDYFDNMSISSFCQDPTNPSVMYFSTGEATSNADAHFGMGVWKSTDKGETWTQLPSTLNYIRNFKLICDISGNVYLASRTTATPALNTSGLLRSKDGGVTWVNITPTLVGTATLTATCTDIELSSTGRFHASFGYSTGGAATVRHYYTNDPANVTQATGWNLSTGIRSTGITAGRLELACLVDTLYGITCNAANNADSCYKSVDGGQTWTRQNTGTMPAGLLSGQAWYSVTLSINPANGSELLCGGLDAYKSSNNGQTWTRLTFWVTTIPYVHADHHYMAWWKKGNEGRLVIGCDGGIFYSNDNGVTWFDKNRNLSLKQFYGADIHPAAGSSYLIAGAQDNGTHQLKNPGLSYSTEVTGGDGMHVWINQQDPNIQFAAYVYSNYRRSVNGGQTWTSFPTNNTGAFTNPYCLDDAQNILYGSYTGNNLARILNANTTTAITAVPVALLNGATISQLKMSPYTANRLFVGSTGGRVLMLDNANATPTVTNITGATFPGGNVSSVNIGSSDSKIVATFSNFGISHVWATTDGGTNWTNHTGNLPDMPVWWALFDPYNNNKMYIGTETGLWSTDLLNGASTIWIPDPGLPTTRIAMLRMRTSDNTVVASTYGRGLFTARIPPSTPEISFVLPNSSVTEGAGAISSCRSYRDYVIKTGIVNAPTGNATVTYSVQGGASATEGVDFDFTTNGNFTTPSKQHIFQDGVLGLKDITIRVYDDTQVEPTETFTLGYTITGSTNATSGPVNLHTFSIIDNDRYPIPFGTANYLIGTNNADLTTLTTPFDGNKLKHRVQYLYRASELTAAGIVSNATINSMKVRVKTKNTTLPFKGLTIQVANTYKTTLNAGYVSGIAFTQVYNADYSTVAGDNTFNFSTPFNWDGTSNVVVQLCWDNISGTPEALTDVMEGMTTPFGVGSRATAYSNYTTGVLVGCSLALSNVDDNRLNATFNATFGQPVATALNSTGTQYLGANTDLYYYSGAGEIMARVFNLSGSNYGCTQVLIDRAGTGAKQFWNTNTADYLMDKTFRIIPTTNNPAGKYEVTFYFTAAEKAGWEAATGHTWDQIQLIKLPSQISNVSPAVAQPDGPGTITVVNPVRRTFGPVYYTLSFLLENGFSGYGFGVPGRMNTILTLTGAANSNNVDVDLSWTTSVEINSTFFEVEKSYDGTNFHKIGTKQASFNKLTPTTYGFVDHENTQFNYYRIKMLHTDGYVLYSNTIFIKRDNAPQRLFVGPNPFGSNMTIGFARPPAGPVYVSFFDAGGKLVKQYSLAGGSASYSINTSGIISRAIYVVRVDANGETLSTRVMKE
jgi:hypothetical protein